MPTTCWGPPGSLWVPPLPSRKSSSRSHPEAGTAASRSCRQDFVTVSWLCLWLSLGLLSVLRFWCISGLNKCYARSEENWTCHPFMPHSDNQESFWTPASSSPTKSYHCTSVDFHNLPTLPTLPCLMSSSPLLWSIASPVNPFSLSSSPPFPAQPIFHRTLLIWSPQPDHTTPYSSVDSPHPQGLESIHTLFSLLVTKPWPCHIAESCPR